MHPTAQVLVVDDEAPFAAVVAGYFAKEGYQVSVAHDGPSALETARHTPLDLVVLDLMLPGMDGVQVCRRLRDLTAAYVLMLTARDQVRDKIIALEAGADDYLVKPASPRELLAHASAMLRRPRQRHPAPAEEPDTSTSTAILRVGDLRVDVLGRTVYVADTEAALTRTEYDLLIALVTHPRRAFSRRQLVDTVWGPDWVGDEHIVDVHIGHVRRKLGDDPIHPRYIRTVRGIGYASGARTLPTDRPPRDGLRA